MVEKAVQQLHLELIKRASYNQLNGKRVVTDLENNRELWKAALMDRAEHPMDLLIKLRDMQFGEWNVDTLFILSSGKDDRRLEELAQTWRANEIGWLPDEQFDRIRFKTMIDQRVLRIWWD